MRVDKEKLRERERERKIRKCGGKGRPISGKGAEGRRDESTSET